ncbi:MAG: acetyl-CoA decarbonylase/synthase complex subunit gamma [Deltaproteobacteria bacterium]|nr:acetyl-CoA decarbonylase/synthase complex subunit gamma [Deltaproteobacteria bacterium]
MALTGIEIFKLLPKTNCQECGVQTCMAFAMKLAAGQAELDACPYVSEDARAQLEEASAPPIRPVIIGSGDSALKIGGENVMFRHEKTFINKPGIGLLLTDAMDSSEVDSRLKKFKELQYERVGVTLQADIIAIKETTGDTAKFIGLINAVKDHGITNLVLMSEKPDVLAEAVKSANGCKPLIYAATAGNADELGKIAKENSCPLAVRGNNLEEVAALTTKLTGMGLKDLVIDSGTRNLRQAFQDHIAIRRAALVGKVRELGFPTIVFPCEMTDDPLQETIIASSFVPKYGGILILSEIEGHNLFPLSVQRMNIYTDPQRPMATTEGIYEINNPDENSPVLITSNFSLTYFVVSGEIESSRIPSWLLIKDTEGLSVLTAWAAGKFVADAIAPFVKKSGIEDKINHRKMIIPGAAATISGELDEELADWDIQIGPREAAHLTPFLKGWQK